MTRDAVLGAWMTPAEAAAWVSEALRPGDNGPPIVTERMVRDRARSGVITRLRVGRRIVVSRASVDAWVASMTGDAGIDDAA